MMQKSEPKNKRMHILFDEKFRNQVAKAAHDSWMSNGQYIREIVSLFHGADFDTASDWVMIGQSIGIEKFEDLRIAAERKGVSISELLELLVKTRSIEGKKKTSGQESGQLSLF